MDERETISSLKELKAATSLNFFFFFSFLFSFLGRSFVRYRMMNFEDRQEETQATEGGKTDCLKKRKARCSS